MRYTLPLRYIDMVARSGSIRSAAEELAIAPSALNRRILAMEEELGVELFERHSGGVRLNSAGELFVQHIRSQLYDLERVKSRIADLSGLRLGHVKIAATKEMSRSFLSKQIIQYQKQFPGVTFELSGTSRHNVEEQLAQHNADIIVIFQPTKLADVHTLLHVKQSIHCLVHMNHPLAKRTSVKLMDCLEYKLYLPPKTEGIRELIEAATLRKGFACQPAIESNDPNALEHAIQYSAGVGFEIPISASIDHTDKNLVSIPLEHGEVEEGSLFIGQLRNRTLPVAAAKFVEDLRKSIQE